jgi:Protein of unknown function (DUF2961)
MMIAMERCPVRLRWFFELDRPNSEGTRRRNESKWRNGVRLVCAIFALFFVASTFHGQVAPASDDLSRIDYLARLRPFVKVGSFSSYDRTGGNDDGFSGKYSFIRKEGDALVVAELQGPGVITRIWTPTPNDSPLEFFFDGETTPRIVMPFREIFEGTHAPFLAPLAGSGGGGFYSYAPLPFQRSCKIRLHGPKMQFFQINYGLYEPGTKVATFDPANKNPQEISKVRDTWNAVAEEVITREAHRERREQILEPGKSVTLFESAQPGRVVAIRLTPASAFAGPDRSLVLKATWDGEPKPAILVPVGDFFGYSFGDPSARSLLVGTENDTAYAYFPMPYDHSARIEIASQRDPGTAVKFSSEVISTSEGRRKDEGRFYARWKRENPVPQGEPFKFVEVEGRGHLVGVILQAQGLEPGQTLFFEGDDEATLDGELAIHGTGSEDFFNGGWYDIPGRWNGRFSLPLSGALDYQKPLGRTGAYRLMLGDAYAFRKSLKLTIEHGGEGNRVPADYAATSFLYLQSSPANLEDLPGAAIRAVSDPEKIVFVPGWNEPIFAFSFQNMNLRKQVVKVDGKDLRVLSIEAQGEEMFGPHYVAFTVKIPKAGDYMVSLDALKGPSQGTVQLMADNKLTGKLASFAAPSQAESDGVELGAVHLNAGENQLFFQLKAEAGSTDPFRADLIHIICRRQ